MLAPRPAEGEPNPADSLGPVADRLGQLLEKPVQMAPDCVGPAVERLIDAMQGGDVLLLENLRFHPGEEANDVTFARELAAAARSTSTTRSARRTERTRPRPAWPPFCRPWQGS